MDLDFERAVTSLAKVGLLRLRDQAGHGVAVLDGCVWITRQGDPRDAFVGAGKAFVLDRPGFALLHACRDTRPVVLVAGVLTAAIGTGSTTRRQPLSNDGPAGEAP